MTTVEKFRPTWKSILRVVIVTSIYMVIIYFLNTIIGSNYMMLNGKPATASLLNLLPPWPGYLIYLEIIGGITIFLLYFPFMLKDLKNNKKNQ